MKTSKRLKLEPYASPKPWPMQFPLACRGRGGEGYSGKALTSGCSFCELYWLHSPWHKTNWCSMTSYGKRVKDKMHSLTPSFQPATLLIALQQSYSFSVLLFFPPFIHTQHAQLCTHQPTQTCRITGYEFYIAFRVKRKLHLSLGTGLHCSQALLYGYTVVRPPHTAHVRIHSKLWHTSKELQEGIVYTHEKGSLYQGFL